MDMIHCWTNPTEGNGSSVRTISVEYRKAFGLIAHKILITELSTLNLPRSMDYYYALLWKYVDDSTVSEIIPEGQSSSAQE